MIGPMGVARRAGLVACWIVVLRGTLWSQEAGRIEPADSAPRAWTYRTYFVPDERKTELTRGFLPMRRNRFQELVKSLGTRPENEAPPAHLARADYFAVLDGDTLRHGVALFEFRADARASAESGPEFAGSQPIVTVERLDLALDEPRWRNNGRPAQWGTDRMGQFRLGVPESDTLVATWSLRGAPGDGDGVAFEFRGPVCPINAIHLAIPPTTRLQSDEGLISTTNGAPDSLSGLPEGSMFRQAVASHASVARIDLGGRGECRLVASATAPPDRPGAIRLRQNERYTMLPSRIELREELHFDCIGQSCDEFRMSTSAELRLLEARFGDQVLDWSVEPMPGGRDAYRIQFPQTMTGVDRVVRLVFHGDLVADRMWQLPSVRVEEPWWSEGRTELVFADSLVLQEIQNTASQLTRRSAVAPGVETLEFQALSSDAAYELLIRPRSAVVNVEGGAAIRIDGESATARILADLRATWGESFRVRLEVTRPWSIDRVELTPPTALDTSAGSWRFKDGILDIPLSEPIAPGRPLRLAIDAHRPAPPGRTGLDGGQLSFWEFLDVHEVDDLLRVEAPPPLRVRLTRDLDVERIDPRSLTADQQGRLGDTTRGLTFRLDRASPATALIVPDVPSLVSEVEVDFKMDGNRCEESFRIRCTPESNPVRQVRVRLSRPRGVPLEWKLARDQTPLAARLVLDGDRADGGSGDELWELDLPEVMESEFTILAARRWTGDGHVELAFASVPQALTESGRVIVRSRRPVRWESSGVESVPPDPAALGGAQGIRGVFRYQPSHTSRLTVWTAESTDGNDLWAWHGELTTRCFADGRSVHDATFLLENLGRDRARIQFVEEVTVTGAWVDDKSVPSPVGLAREISIPLSPTARYPVLRVRFASRGAPLGFTNRVVAPLPQLDAPLPSAIWTIYAPRDYDIASGTNVPRTTTQPGLTLSERLCGGLVRPRQAWRTDQRDADGGDGKPPSVTPPGPVTPPGQSPWIANASSSSDGISELGWMSVMIDVTAPSQEVKVTLYRRNSWRSVGWACFVMCAVGVSWLSRTHRRWTGVVLGVAAAIACFLPAPLAPLGAGLFLGSAAGTVVGMLRPVTSAGTVFTRGWLRPRWLAAGAAILVIVTALWSIGQEIRPGAAVPAGAEDFRILVPVDGQGNLVGEYLYVPRAFHDVLLRESAVDGHQEPWISAARYSARSAGMDDASREIHELQAHLILHSAGPQTAEVAFRRTEVQLLNATVDGAPADVRWNPAGDAILVVLNSPGRHELDLALRTRRAADGVGLDVAVPIVHATSCEWISSGSDEHVEFPLAVGAVERHSGGTRAVLGRTGRLVARAGPRGADDTAITATGDRLAWLRIRPNSVVIELKLAVQAVEGRLDELVFRVDPRLRLLPVVGNNPFEGEPIVQAGDETLMRWRLKPAAGARFTANLAFHWVDSAGIGRLDMPRIDFPQIHMSRSWLAVSHGATLRVTEAAPQSPALLPVEPFVELWRDDNPSRDEGEVPWRVYDELTKAHDDARTLERSFDSSFTPPSTGWTDITNIEARADRLRISWSAVLDSTAGPQFIRRLLLPPNLRLQSVTVQQNGERQPVRYAVGERGALTVFLTTPPMGRQELSLRGEISVPRDGQVDFPRIALTDGELASSIVRITRQHSVAELALENVESWRNEDVPTTDGTEIRDARPFGVWHVTPEAWRNSNARIRVVANPARAEGFLATRLVREGANSWAEIEYHLRVDEGLHDTLRLEIPADWDGPFELEPALPFELRNLSGQNRRELVARPEQPITDHFRLRIRAPWAVSNERMRRVPDLSPIDVQRAVRFLVLPTRWDTQTLVWTTSGLQARELPRFFQMAEQQTDAWESYQILGPDFHAGLERVERVTGLPRVHLADHRVELHLDGHYLGVSTFDLEPGGATQCGVQVAAGGRLLAASIDGIQVDISQDDDAHSMVPLASPQLAQRLELFYTASAEPGADRSWRVQAPTIDDLPVTRTLWTILGSWRADGRLAIADGNRVSSARQNMVRLESAAEIVKSGYAMAAETDRSEARGWLGLWASRAARARNTLARPPIEPNSPEGADLAVELGNLESQWKTENHPLVGGEGAALLESGEPMPVDLGVAWDASRSPARHTMSGSFSGPVPSLTIFESRARSDWLFRITVACAALLTGCLLTAVGTRGARFDFVREHPRSILAVVGLACVATLQPAALGWTLFGTAVLLALRDPWR